MHPDDRLMAVNLAKTILVLMGVAVTLIVIAELVA